MNPSCHVQILPWQEAILFPVPSRGKNISLSSESHRIILSLQGEWGFLSKNHCCLEFSILFSMEPSLQARTIQTSPQGIHGFTSLTIECSCNLTFRFFSRIWQESGSLIVAIHILSTFKNGWVHEWPHSVFCLTLFQPYPDNWPMPCVEVGAIPPDRRMHLAWQVSAYPKSSKPSGVCDTGHADIHFQRRFKAPDSDPILKTFLIYYFLTDTIRFFKW